MIKPPFLEKGALVAIVATARKITKEELMPAINLLESWGLKHILGDSIGVEEHQFAGSDALRAKDFQQQLDNSNVNAIWCARGGYGTVRMIDLVDFSNFKNNPKWIIGYSDVTVLHTHINALGFATIHGQMCLEIEKRTEESRATLKELLFGNFKEITIASTSKHNREGKVNGKLIGGNLSVLMSILGSISEVELKGAILFIEDLDEMLYHIDRMLQTLKRAGYLKNISGLIVGGMSSMRDNAIPFGETAIEIIATSVAEYEYPVCFNFPAGHIEDNRALVMGAEIDFEVHNTSATIKYKQ
ncbi:peptidase S66 [Patiriisocius marinus]|uniref:Peptidase S66 n=1 Tax=Patiriisocius marinus TaxID=1397112 RepID=A0A5J4IY18_9FLAO|nr:LD-carboxypeptidase [Patiriisocius marinus]GER58471.1 peptidase S66 [Patiriisocius marinus]